ncbi:AAA family ATPase [Brenneria goodwinii]|uniref:AAA domain-containing protein n=1 Tax=Brenneria goodwinii TaxID=1109412 RepID=UPI000EF1BEB8|nr:AAA domain-containing protein [Brenneria goodwinii]MCG8156157.1 AAA family ATPase [Brenneria goodwinii]MCG8160802.1 AAA family ATPase [Brenneria goodwinii]MCG8165868.1 AAA family ATPase [Brenneria goodwinii]MCG8170356.1 AAA family ATPase [Brenneria goodwinii]MCG8175224.1 AAA family ATPase [Brenneria goodwinii]
MVAIYVNGADKTGQITDWTLKYNDAKDELWLTCHFPSDRTYSRPITDCKVIPTERERGNLLIEKGKSVFTQIECATTYGGKYTVVRYPGKRKLYVMKTDNVEIVAETNIKDEPVFNYFVSVAQARIDHATGNDRPIAENVLRQLLKVVPHPDTVLHAYCSGQSRSQEPVSHFIFPFGINESQLKAVEQAFTSQISLIEGPPGTGKTQTILNIVANILLQQKSVAILSNNNSAVENVYEKLGKVDLDYLVAKLGSTDNRNRFFESSSNAPTEKPVSAPDIQDIDATLKQLKTHLHAQNQVAILQAQIDELSIEKKYLLQWQRDNLITAPRPIEKYRLSPQKITDLMAYLNYLAARRIAFTDRVRLLLNFRILRVKEMNDWEQRISLIYSLQLHYYEKALQQKKERLASYQKTLQDNNFKALLNHLTNASMVYLKNHLYQHIPHQTTFDVKNYRRSFNEFIKRYPIIGSSTHSIINSIANGALLDYVIIDEASQQDIIPGILGLGCAKNIIIVGDRKQLPHVPAKLDVTPPSEFYDCVRYSLLDSFVSIFKNTIPETLLKEHYRCHPKIIQFCNKQFYDNQLIPMTHDKGEEALSLIITAKGNHTRKYSNLRELESLEALDWDEECNRGFIAPYNNQVALSQKHLPVDFVKATVHKFQGRECDEIIFSTVLDKKWHSQRNVGFVDDPHLVNVAVSRAKNNFTLVTGDNVFTKNNKHIAALIRYIEYYSDDKQIHRSPVISAFDLLYKEYDQSLEKLNARLNPNDSRFKSEQIVAQLLREILSLDAYHAIMFHTQIALLQLVSLKNNIFTPRELAFMNNCASCDFVLYFKVGKAPLSVIEVDGSYHDTPRQAERDEVKNSILNKSNIPLLRLKTIDSNITGKITAFLTDCLSDEG